MVGIIKLINRETSEIKLFADVLKAKDFLLKNSSWREGGYLPE